MQRLQASTYRRPQSDLQGLPLRAEQQNQKDACIGFGIRDISVIEEISIFKVLSILVGLNYSLKPKYCHCESLEIDEFHTFVGSKKNKMWLIYAYSRASKEIVCYVWGKRNILFPLKNYVVLNYCHTVFDAVSSEIKRDNVSSAV